MFIIWGELEIQFKFNKFNENVKDREIYVYCIEDVYCYKFCGNSIGMY